MADPSSSPRRSGLTRLCDELERITTSLGGPDAPLSLDRLVETSRSTVSSADSVSLTSLRRGRFSTTAATSDLARRGDALQYAVGSGPCVDAVLEQAITHPEDLAHDTRWPTFGRAASRDLGIRSMLCYRLGTESDDSIDALNFYATKADAFSEDDLLRGLVIATQATLTIIRSKADHLTRALVSSREIGAAVGILMAVDHLTYDRALQLLRVASQGRNRSLHLVAGDVVRTGTLELPHLA